VLPDEIGNYLAGASLGLTVGTNLFYVPIPDAAPDPAVGILETPGAPSAGAFGVSLSAPAFEYPRFVVIVRGGRDTVSTARTLAESIHKKLERLGPVTLAGTVYFDVRAAQPPFGPDYDKNERPVYRAVYEATKERSVA
jgi:hypothetical protein